MEITGQEIYNRLRAIIRREWKIIILVGFVGSVGAAIINIIIRGIPIFQATQFMVMRSENREISILSPMQVQQMGKTLSDLDVILAKMKYPEFYEGLWDTSIAYEVLRGSIKGVRKFVPGVYNEKNGKDIVICPCSKKFKVVIYDSVGLWDRLSKVITKILNKDQNPLAPQDVRFFSVSYVSPDRRWILNSTRVVSQWIIEKHLKNKRENLLRQKLAITKLLDFYRKEIDKFADSLKEIKKNLRYPEYTEEEIYKSLVKLSNQKSALINLRNKLLNGKTDTFLILTGDETIDELQSRRIKYITEYITLKTSLGDRHPSVKESKTKLGKINKLILSSIDERISYLNSQINFFKSILPVVIEEQAQLLTTKRNLENAEDFYIILGQNLNDVEVKLSSMVPDISVIGSPRISLYSKYTRTRNVLPIGFLAGIIIGFLLAVFRDMTTEYVLDESYLPFDNELIFSLPKFSDDDTLPVLMVRENILDINSPALNEFRKMAFKLNVFENLKELIAITSTQSGEGKTFISANFAATLSISGVPTFLIDGDVRMRSLTEYMGFSGYKGYTDEEFKAYSINDNLIFLPVGIKEMDTLAAFRRLLEYCKDYLGKYIIVIDMPPVGVSPEIKLLEKFATKFVLITRYNYTLRTSLKNLEIDPSLVVFNFASEKTKYYSGYYKKYGKKRRRNLRELLKRIFGLKISNR